VIRDHPVVPMPEQLLDDWLGSLEIKRERDGEPVDRIPESDDSALSQMCSKARLLEIVHDFMVFDAGVNKTCRHNQYFGVKAARPRVQRTRSRTALRQAAHAWDVTSMSE
jgi:type I site-specific restriction-modification system R (restriction) subunit